ncbi:NUDIX domain-containing protein [Streptomyces sp. NPDC059740]|uniref:NUDIX domain-containing protein n=1 Tax=Streptomyces sp. NPDC059740 TaxID=3346926 RepID=UPI003658D95E
MAARRSAGLMVYRRPAGGVEVLLGHMGGPFWARREAGAWTVPKGEYEAPEEAWEAARREFREELGLEPPGGAPVPLGSVRQRGGKVVEAWAVEGEVDLAAFAPGTFEMEWPRGSGVLRAFPELDRVSWHGWDSARALLVSGQHAFLDRLAEHLAQSG